MSARHFSCAMLLITLLATTAFGRKWTDVTGKYSTEADFVKIRDGNAILKTTNGQEIRVPLDKLSAADQEFIKSIAKPERPGEPSQKDEKPPDAAPNVPLKQKEAKKPPTAEQLLKLVKDAGFDGTGVPVLFERVDAGTGRKLSSEYLYVCRNKRTGANLEVYRNVVGLFGFTSPGPRFRVVASPKEKDQEALFNVAKGVSKELRGACEEAVAAYRQGKRDSEKTVETVRVVASQDGLQIESVPTR